MRFLNTAIILCATLSAVAGDFGGNIIVNPGFESVKDGFAAGWRNYNNGAKLTTDNLDAENGRQALVVTGADKLCGFQQNVKVRPGARYKIETNTLFDGFTAGDVTPIYVTIHKTQGPYQALPLVTVKPEEAKNIDGWKKYSAVLDMSKFPDCNGWVCVWSIVSKDFRGSVYFDNFTMREIIETPAIK
jgi:hypothetical protein